MNLAHRDTIIHQSRQGVWSERGVHRYQPSALGVTSVFASGAQTLPDAYVDGDVIMVRRRSGDGHEPLTETMYSTIEYILDRIHSYDEPDSTARAAVTAIYDTFPKLQTAEVQNIIDPPRTTDTEELARLKAAKENLGNRYAAAQRAIANYMLQVAPKVDVGGKSVTLTAEMMYDLHEKLKAAISSAHEDLKNVPTEQFARCLSDILSIEELTAADYTFLDRAIQGFEGYGDRFRKFAANMYARGVAALAAYEQLKSGVGADTNKHTYTHDESAGALSGVSGCGVRAGPGCVGVRAEEEVVAVERRQECDARYG